MSTREQPRPSELEGHCVMLQVTHRRQPQDAGCHAPGLLWVILKSLYFCFQRCTPPSVLRVAVTRSSLACTTAWVVVFRPVSWWECELAVPRPQLPLCKRLLSSQQSSTRSIIPAQRDRPDFPAFQALFVCWFALLWLLSRVFLTRLASPARSLALPKESLRAPCEDND